LLRRALFKEKYVGNACAAAFEKSKEVEHALSEGERAGWLAERKRDIEVRGGLSLCAASHK
jgi:hypothetical protein